MCYCAMWHREQANTYRISDVRTLFPWPRPAGDKPSSPTGAVGFTSFLYHAPDVDVTFSTTEDVTPSPCPSVDVSLSSCPNLWHLCVSLPHERCSDSLPPCLTSSSCRGWRGARFPLLAHTRHRSAYLKLCYFLLLYEGHSEAVGGKHSSPFARMERMATLHTD